MVSDQAQSGDGFLDPATVSEGKSFLTAAHWIARVLDPNRPRAAQITAWAGAIRSAAGEPDPKVATHISRPRSLLAQRLAEHVAILLKMPTAADALAGRAQIASGAPLLELTLALAYEAGIHVAFPTTPLRGVWATLETAQGGRKAAYSEYRRVLDALVTDVDPADTESRIRDARLAAYRRNAAAV